MALIDKETIRAEIERQIEMAKERIKNVEAIGGYNTMDNYLVCYLEKLLAFINFMPKQKQSPIVKQKEQPEVDLEREVEKYLLDNADFVTKSTSNETVNALARHFAEWGERNAYKTIMKKADEVRDKMYDIDYDIKIGQIEPIKEYKEPLTWEDIEECIAEISSSKGAEHLKE